MTKLHPFNEGDCVCYTLVTDTRAFFVTKVTEKSIWIAPAHRTSITKAIDNGSPYPTVLTAVEPLIDCEPTEIKRVGLRKDGTFRVAGWAHSLRHTPTTDFGDEGVRPFESTDYSY